ncbi:MAG: replicative DNA helicase [Actinomycetota bacterium]|nr:replicative DNA helicase [Actinomycetota bacterium]
MSGARAEPPAVPLHDLDAEAAVIGCCLAWRGAVEEALDAGLRPEDFHRPAFGHAFAVACSLAVEGESVDAVTVAAECARRGLPGPSPADLLAAVGDAPAISRAASYARVVVDLARRRAILAALLEAVEAAKGAGDIEEIAGRVDSLVTAALTGDDPAADGLVSIGDAADAALCELREGTSKRLPTGFPDLDRLLLGGIVPGHLVIVGARPSMGKTAFALGVARRVAERGQRVLFASAEQGAEELAERMLVDVGRVPSDRVRPTITADHLGKLSLAASAVRDLPIDLLDRGVSLGSIARAARRLARCSGLGLVIVDYLQLLDGERAERRELEVAGLSRGLKFLARELDVPVVALSQLNRGVEERVSKRPVLADLRESGSLEQDADVVLFIYRDEIYSPDTSARGIAEILIAKHRNGPTGVVQLAFLARRMAFATLAREDLL